MLYYLYVEHRKQEFFLQICHIGRMVIIHKRNEINLAKGQLIKEIFLGSRFVLASSKNSWSTYGDLWPFFPQNIIDFFSLFFKN